MCVFVVCGFPRVSAQLELHQQQACMNNCSIASSTTTTHRSPNVLLPLGHTDHSHSSCHEQKQDRRKPSGTPSRPKVSSYSCLVIQITQLTRNATWYHLSGLGRLKWYCQVCQKQCRDENGFKMHSQSESCVPLGLAT